MTRSTLRYWMWGYQEHFRKGVQSLARKVLAEIAAPCEAEVLLVGVRAPEASREDPVCIDPEFGPVPIETFESLETVVEAAIPHHPMQEIFYGDAARMADKPRIIRAKVIIDQVRARLAPHDDEQDVVSFVGFPQRVNDYLVAVVLRVPKVAFERHPELVLADVYGEKHDVGFFRACVSQLLATASERLQRPDPGRALGEDLLSPEEIARRGASSFLRAVSAQICDYHGGTDLFERLNDISALRYEGNGGVGRLVFMKPKVDTADFLFKLDEPVGLKEARWCRKILEMASGDAAMIATVREVLGLCEMCEEASVLQDRFAAVVRIRLGQLPIPSVDIGLRRRPLKRVAKIICRRDEEAFLLNHPLEARVVHITPQGHLRRWRLREGRMGLDCIGHRDRTEIGSPSGPLMGSFPTIA